MNNERDNVDVMRTSLEIVDAAKIIMFTVEIYTY